MTRLQRGDEIVDAWVEDTEQGIQMYTREGSGPVVAVTMKSFHIPREYMQFLTDRLHAGWHRVRDPAREVDVDDEPREPTLEAALAADPGDVTTALVYADWYQQHDHPRGDLIAVQCARAASPDDPVLRAREAELFASWHAHLLGPIDHPGGQYELRLELAWEHGFVRAARLDGRDRRGVPEQLLWELLRHPSARFLRELVIGCHDYGDQDNRLMTDLLLHAGPTPPLRTLILADFDDTRSDDIDISRAPLGDLTGLGDRYPMLEDVILKGRGDCELGGLALPHARRFAFRTSSLTRITLARVIAADWPALEELELWFGNTEYGGDCTAADVAPLVARGMPKLRVLRLMNTLFSDDLCELIATSPRAATLATLDFSLGTLSDDGAAVLAARRAAFANLTALHVNECCLTSQGLARLRAAGFPVADTNRQKDRRYVSVSE
ncbi:MAG: TIGR02996 domain-containing protein [Kofleriaceae bacterium]